MFAISGKVTHASYSTQHNVCHTVNTQECQICACAEPAVGLGGGVPNLPLSLVRAMASPSPSTCCETLAFGGGCSLTRSQNPSRCLWVRLMLESSSFSSASFENPKWVSTLHTGASFAASCHLYGQGGLHWCARSLPTGAHRAVTSNGIERLLEAALRRLQPVPASQGIPDPPLKAC